MNNYILIMLSNYGLRSKVTARFEDGNRDVRRYMRVTPSSIRRLQDAMTQAVKENKFKIRLPIGYDVVSWVADRSR